MTISDTNNTIQYDGNGSTDTFSTGTIVFYSPSDLVVTQTNISTGADTLLTLTTDYTVTGGGGAAGSVVLVAGNLATGQRITISRSIPYSQTDDYVEGENILAETIETAFDKAVIRDQQLRDSVNKSLKFKDTLSSSLVGKITQTPVDGSLLSWSGVTGDIVNVSTADLSGSNVDTLFTNLLANDFFQYDGTNWVNRATPKVADIDAGTTAGGALRTNAGADCISWGAGGTANSTLGGNMSGASTYKLVNMVDPTSAQDYATKAYVDTNSGSSAGYANTRYYSNFISTTGAAFSNDVLYATPIFISETTTFTRIGINVTGGTGSAVGRLGIYNAENGIPTSLVLDAGETGNFSSTGDKEITINQSLNSGWYFLAVVSDLNNIEFATVDTDGGKAGFMMPAMGAETLANNYLVGFSMTHAFAALPLTYTVTATIKAATSHPNLWLRKAP